MYRKTEHPSTTPENFDLPFEGKLSEDNRWVIMEKLIPWSEFEGEYAEKFSTEIGSPAKTFRMALGALIIKEILGVSDRETVLQIQENPYLQYFIGLKTYSNEAPFEASLLVHFRKRISQETIHKINEKMVSQSGVKKEEFQSKKDEEQKKNRKKNEGRLLLDATCSPADITYPQDLKLLNETRIQLEKIIDKLYKPLKLKLEKKPRTYRKAARKAYLLVAKKRKVKASELRRAIKKQLQYIKRNLLSIERLLAEGSSLTQLKKKEYKNLLVAQTIYSQQLWMYENKKRSIENRIVSLNQPHLRPIVRGKAGKAVEFGAKLSVSCREGYVFLDHLSWENFNESTYLKSQVEKYKQYTGYYPESVHVDKIYRTRENLRWCKEKGIRVSGPKLGRPALNISREDKKQAQKDERIRNEIEGKFGLAKRRYGLNLVMTKLPETSETSIAITFLVINLMTLLRRVCQVIFWLSVKQLVYDLKHKKNLCFN